MCELLSQNDILRRMKLKKQEQTTLFLDKSVKHKVFFTRVVYPRRLELEILLYNLPTVSDECPV